LAQTHTATLVGPNIQKPDNIEQRAHSKGSTNVNSPSPESGHEEKPTAYGTKQSEYSATDVQIIDNAGVESDLLEEVSGVVGNRCTGHDLASETETTDLGPPQLKAFKTVPLRYAN